VTASQREMSAAYLDADGKWGRMDKSRWDQYLDWLSDSGLLTTYMQSRYVWKFCLHRRSPRPLSTAEEKGCWMMVGGAQDA